MSSTPLKHIVLEWKTKLMFEKIKIERPAD